MSAFPDPSRLRNSLLVGLAVFACMTTSTASAAVDPVDIEDEVMCIVCERPLATSAGKAAEDQRELIASLIAEGKTKQQVKDALVAEYGEAVLVKNSSPLAGAAPWAAAIVGLGTIGLLLRRRTQVGGDASSGAADGSTAAGAAPLAAADEARIDAELAELD